MVENLNNLLKGCLIIPYEENIVDKLSEVCKLYAQNHSSNNDVAKLALSIFTRQWNGKFKEELECLYTEQFSAKFHLPQCAMKAFATHVIELILAEDEDRELNSLALINCMIVLNQHFEQFPYPHVFAKYMTIFDEYFLEHGKLDNSDDTEALNELFNMEDDELEKVNADVVAKYSSSVHSLARDAWYYRTYQYLTSNEVTGLENAYMQAYIVLKQVVKSIPWYFINQQFLQMIGSFLTKQEEKSETISNIVVNLKSGVSDNIENIHDSSILLRLLSGDETFCNLSFIDTSLTPKEFAVYLYYELMLEKKFE